MKIIGLTGKARAGKDTVAELMSRSVRAREYSLADPIKMAAAEMFGIPLDNFYDPMTKEEPDEYWDISPREMAQKLGTEGGRDLFGNDIWLKRCEKEIANLTDIRSFNGLFIIRDVRFENEAKFVRKSGGHLIHILRDSLGEGVVRSHVSEDGVEIKDEDVVLNNNGSLEDIEENVKNMLTKMSIPDTMYI